MIIQLPHGLLDGVDLFNYAEIDELRGKQQNYLVDKELVVGNIGHVEKILEELVLSFQTREGLRWKGDIKDGIQRITAGDIETILVKIRENTYGPRFYHEAQCPHCGYINKDLRLDLDTLQLNILTLEEILQPKIIHLPKENVDVELKPLLLSDLYKVIKITRDNTNKLITSTLAVTIKRIGNKSPITVEDIDNLRASDIDYLQSQLKDLKIDGSIDTDLQIECQKCKKEFEAKLNCFDPSFFVPTRGSMSMTI